MNRDQKATAIAEIVTQIDESSAIFAVDYRGISVPEAAELRAKLREADATFKVVKNSLTERAADEAGVETLKGFLSGPTALTFVRGDVAVAAKAIADYARATQLLPFKGGLMDGAEIDPDQIRAISRLPSREVLYGQLVGVVASPVSGLVRTLGALVSGLAVALGQVRDKKESGELPAGEPPAAQEPAPDAAAEEPAGEQPAEDASAQQASDGESAEPQEPEAEAAVAEEAKVEDAPAEEAVAKEPDAEGPEAQAAEGEDKAEPEEQTPAQEDDNQADVSAQAESEDAETNPKED
jgi:large subunit ribosomal protein L10